MLEFKINQVQRKMGRIIVIKFKGDSKNKCMVKFDINDNIQVVF